MTARKQPTADPRGIPVLCARAKHHVPADDHNEHGPKGRTACLAVIRYMPHEDEDSVPPSGPAGSPEEHRQRVEDALQEGAVRDGAPIQGAPLPPVLAPPVPTRDALVRATLGATADLDIAWAETAAARATLARTEAVANERIAALASVRSALARLVYDGKARGKRAVVRVGSVLYEAKAPRRPKGQAEAPPDALYRLEPLEDGEPVQTEMPT